MPALAFFNVSGGRNLAADRPDRPYYQDKERGWFWYEPEPLPDDIIETEIPPATLGPQKPDRPPPEKPKAQPPAPLSSEWFRANLTQYRDIAIDDPSPNNVSRYLYLQRVMLDKAERFSEVSQQVVMADAVLDENSRRPIATFGAYAMDDQAKLGEEKVVKQLAKEVGIWFFYSSTCDFCLKEAKVLKSLSYAYGFKVLAIALDGLPLPDNSFPNYTVDQGQARQLGVDVTPALFLVKPGEEGGIVPIAQGLLAADEFVKRAIVLGHQKGWIADDQYRDTLKAKPLTVDPAALQTIRDEDVENPDALVEKIKANLRSKL